MFQTLKLFTEKYGKFVDKQEAHYHGGHEAFQGGMSFSTTVWGTLLLTNTHLIFKVSRSFKVSRHTGGIIIAREACAGVFGGAP